MLSPNPTEEKSTPLAERMPPLSPLSDSDYTRDNHAARDIIKKISGHITDNPEKTLAVQGNIHKGSVINLFAS